MSASAMGLDMQYFIVTSYIDKIDFSLYNKSLTDVATDVIERIREENSTYYNEEETQLLVKAEKITKTLNELPVGLRQSVFLNSYKEFVFDERKFNYLLQMDGRI
jgi:F0F1-type ATP synthase beta subunit